MQKTTFIRQCAHNLNERRNIQALIDEKGISRVRLNYLRSHLKRLQGEKKFFEKIKHEFIITAKDSFRL